MPEALSVREPHALALRVVDTPLLAHHDQRGQVTLAGLRLQLPTTRRYNTSTAGAANM